eukprot:3863592-Rhodomonas_salina.1
MLHARVQFRSVKSLLESGNEGSAAPPPPPTSSTTIPTREDGDDEEEDDAMVLEEDTVLLDPMGNTPLRIHEADIATLAHKESLDALPLRLTSAGPRPANSTPLATA